MTSQLNILLKHLSDKGGITSLEAIKLYGITRLASRVCDLRQQGYEIVDCWEENLNRYGDKVRYKRYFLLDCNNKAV